MRTNQLPGDLTRDVKNHCRAALARQRAGGAHAASADADGNEIYAALPPALRCRVAMHVDRELVSRVAFLRRKSPHFVTAVLEKLDPTTRQPGEAVYLQVHLVLL